MPLSLAPSEPRARLRLRSLAWALLAAAGAGGLGLAAGIEPALRSAGCGFFLGLLSFHLQRVDPDDGHLQAGLVGAVCGLRSLGAPLPQTLPAPGDGTLALLPAGMMELIRAWLPLWLPLAGSALLLHGARRLLPALRP
ncbi:MAG: hypothetical protein VKI81_10205 [Synechococcaceae cyanobacterium]|nr:hypothetical protein [Synechococcaceae cyanobacterium]